MLRVLYSIKDALASSWWGCLHNTYSGGLGFEAAVTAGAAKRPEAGGWPLLSLFVVGKELKDAD
jgi:hypothetical protein